MAGWVNSAIEPVRPHGFLMGDIMIWHDHATEQCT